MSLRATNNTAAATSSPDTTTTNTQASSSAFDVAIDRNPPRPKRVQGIISTSKALLECWKTAHDDTLILGQSKTGSEALSNAVCVLKDAGDLNQTLGEAKKGAIDGSFYVPFSVLRAIQIVFQETGRPDQLEKLENALQGSSLWFADSLCSSNASTEASTSTPNDKSSLLFLERSLKFQKRMDRLRLQVEEKKYVKLTDNLQDHKNEDDITAKSMTFAASVGLNMIIAPLSFGCFMYFFAGGIFDYFFSGDEFQSENKRGGTDIKRVIIGVVSGVVMMIIEMLLFVIRTHEFEEHSRKKKRKKGVEPFGVYTKNTPAVYIERSKERMGTTKKDTSNRKKEKKSS